MTTFAILKTAVADWTARTDLGTFLPILISTAEAHIAQKVRMLDMETDLEITTDATGDVALPAGFLGFVSIEVKDAPFPSTEWVPPDALRKIKAEPTFGGRPVKWTTEAGKIKTTSNSSETFSTTYFKRLDALSDSNPTNFLLTQAFHVYLWSTLAVTWDFLQEEQQEAKYWKKYNAAVEDLHGSERKKRTSGPLVRQLRRRLG